ncbi:MAG: 50S ribosomal protein L11 methyltransferase [Methylotenera sp.]|nr:50S ribosomal protein L11 methyltransferase [Oligoflexia bacterium]
MTSQSVPHEGSTYRLKLGVPRSVTLDGHTFSREEFYSWIWREFTEQGLLGIHEGTLLSEEAAGAGLETESWTIDAAEAPRERDWIESQIITETELYFASEELAQRAQQIFKESAATTGLEVGRIEEQKTEDWDAQWKASFTGATVPPCWKVIPPWIDGSGEPGEIYLKINPGAGFGTGTHETTQLCMGILADCFKRNSLSTPLSNPRVLDFGSGSGILSIAAALLGGKVDGVEIDTLAIDNANENASLNEVQSQVKFSRTLADVSGSYRIVLANILKPVLLQFAEELVSRMEPRSDLILSGLMAPDVAAVTEKFSSLLGRQPELRELNEWRALWWRSEA